ncbi:hypothetical protein TSAR_011197 [Trichomalopsis sarcophagae]|uniref:G-protein coupled receptors family 2 profile 2 domain-containing protein n=1 Tax=Trichomalopsis sarcophagae TaxID=543379 RepID=A0A232FE72_9HYME|nr:hypothetical protein TSAR_011197 [Trichomalopsis sarcophagae]
MSGSGSSRILVFLLLLQLLRSSRARIIDKCCRNGDVLVLTDDASNILRCLPQLREEGMSFYSVESSHSVGLPNCTSHYVLRLPEDEPRTIPSTSCLDVFFDRSTLQYVPVIVLCAESEARPATIVPEISRFFDIRKCCPGDEAVYDVDKKFCARRAAESRGVEDAGHTPDLRGFIAVYNGPPTCEHALVDYKLGKEDVYYNDDDEAAGGAVSISIPWNGSNKRNITIDRDNACLDWISTSGGPAVVAARVCREADYCLANPCIRKCCPENKINIKCRDAGSVEKFRASLAAANASDGFDPRNYGLLIGKPCKSYYVTEPSEQWSIGREGELLVIPNYPVHNHVNSCLEFVQNDSDRDDGIYPVVCFDSDEHYVPDARYEITSVLALISSIFLLATLLVYVCLPGLQNLHGKTLMCHVTSLLFAYGFLGITGLLTHTVFDQDGIDEYVVDKVCKYLGYAILFCFHAAFFWLNVMCFDIWWTFGGMRGQSSAASKRRQQHQRFLAYCGYAWGLAFVITSIAATVELTGLLDSSVGRERCWFASHSIGGIVFFAVPVSITLLMNVVFFAITSHRCSKIKADIKRAMTGVKDPSSRKFHSDKTRRLFVVMGIPWILENVPVYLSYYGSFPLWAQEVFYVADVVNSLQGLWIFVLFVLKPKVFRALRKRFETGPSKGNNMSKSCSANKLNVVHQMGNVRKSSSTSTITSNFVVSSSAYN